MPLQKETSQLVCNPLFKEVFSFYSSFDLLQIIDPQGLYEQAHDRPLFSERQFPNEHIIQVKIKLNGRALLHVDFILVHFLQHLPIIINKMRTWQHTIKDQPELILQSKILSIYTKT